MPRDTPAALTFFAPCPRGLEPCLLAEIQAAGGTDSEAVPGGAHFRGAWTVCYRLNLTSRIATRVLWRVARGPYRDEADVYRLVHAQPWLEWFDVNRTIRVYVTAVHSPLRSLEWITIHIKDALCAKCTETRGARPTVNTEAPDVRIHAFFDATHVTLYLDTSGDPLFKRGYRASSAEAPLKENLAAGLLQLAGWTPGTPLLDPMCGSGTILIEAAQMALGIAPGSARTFGFEKLKRHDPIAWRRIRQQVVSQAMPVRDLPIFGCDISPREIRTAEENLAKADLTGAVRLKVADIRSIKAPMDSGTMITNPPYGVRLSSRESLAEFYPQLGTLLKREFAGWNCFILSADPDLARTLGLRPSRRTPLFNGAIECRLLEYRMVAGSLRPPRPEPAEDAAPPPPAAD